MVKKTDAVDYHAHDAEPGSDTDDDYDCFVPLEAAEDREDAEMGAQVNASAHLPEEHNRSLQQDQEHTWVWIATALTHTEQHPAGAAAALTVYCD